MARILKLPNPGCVLNVGKGRGFIIEHLVRIRPLPKEQRLQLGELRLRKFRKRRWVITAAHCLPYLPPAHGGAYYAERTYKLLGTLDGTMKDVWAECQFVDPVADIAIFDTPDTQERYEEALAYDALIDEAPVLRMGPARTGRGWVLSLENQWIPTRLKVITNHYSASSLLIGPTKPGMSGSPILNDAGEAVGVVALGQTIRAMGEHEDLEGPQQILTRVLPGWLAQGIQSGRRKRH
jgi:hypothetical protein